MTREQFTTTLFAIYALGRIVPKATATTPSLMHRARGPRALSPRPVNTTSYRLLRFGSGVSMGLKIRCREGDVGHEAVRAFIRKHSRKSSALTPHHRYPTNVEEKPQLRLRESIKGPISVPVSPSNAVECYPCREVPLNYNRSLLFHGGDTGSIPVRDAKLESPLEISRK